MSKSREIEVFGMSFMDLISCGLGGVIVLMLIFSTLVKNGSEQNGQEAVGGNLAESENAFNRRLELREICHFYLEIDVTAKETSEDVSLNLEYQPGVVVDSMTEELSSYWKRYVISYSLPGKNATGLFPFRLNGGLDQDYNIRLRLFTDDEQSFQDTFSTIYDFSVKKIAADYILKTE